MDIRNTADSVNYLANCTKIEGFLLISLIDAPQIITGTFPLLTEVTEFIIVYRVWGLESLAQLFPNLSVIRGNALFDGYSLMVHSNPNLKYVGLTKLRSITNGGVRIEKNANLCYANTIDWLHIMADNATAWDVAVVNGDLSSCEACPVKSRSGGSDDTGISCKQYPGKKSYCWNSNSCQTSKYPPHSTGSHHLSFVISLHISLSGEVSGQLHRREHLLQQVVPGWLCPGQ